VPDAEPPHATHAESVLATHAESVHAAHAESVHAARADSLHADTLRTARAEPSGATHAEVPRAPRRTKTSRSAPPAAGNRPRRAPAECGDLPFIIRRDGTWLYRGSPIGRKELVCLFASVLQREEDGSFWLQTPAERGRIDVEDAPFVAVELDWSGHGRNQVLSFRTNVDQIVTAGPDHPIRIAHDLLTCEPTPYIMIRPGAGVPAVEARIGRAVYYELVALGVPELYRGRHMLGVWSCGQFFPLGELPPGND
jgi:hypothetical protein